ncbi:hypothetical protein OF387_02380 [Lentilactobacillus hilgardii]|nr:hypothetical protein [Lentilactobacillus hilgardii]MCV3740063.1 hypothetical protein [Lentilactobacillus hilgardii]
MNKSEQFLDFFNKAYNEPDKHSNYSTNSELRFDSRSDALTVKRLLEDQSPYAKYYHLSAEYINPNQSMQVGWYLTVRKIADPSKDDQSSEDHNDPNSNYHPKNTH